MRSQSCSESTRTQPHPRRQQFGILRLTVLGSLACLVGTLLSVGTAAAEQAGFPQAYNPETAPGYTNTFTPPTASLNPRCANAIAATPGSDPASIALNPALNNAASRTVGGRIHYVYDDNPHGAAFNFTIQTCQVVYRANFFAASDFDPVTGILTSSRFSKQDLVKNGTPIDGASLDGISDPGGNIYFSWTVQSVANGSWVCNFARDIRANHGGGGNRKAVPSCLQIGPPQPRQTIQGEIYSCVDGRPTTTLVPGGSITVPTAGLSSSNPLTPTAVAAGSYQVNATAPAGLTFVSCGQTGVTIGTPPTSAKRTVTVPTGGSADAKFYVEAGYGWVEVCQSSANNVTGPFTFKFAGNTQTIPAGSCGSAKRVPATDCLVVTQVFRAGFGFVGASTAPANRLVSVNASQRSACVKVPVGGISTQTIVTFVNKRTSGTVKVCQIAGTGIAVGRDFTFSVTDEVGVRTFPVTAGPDGGYCVVAGSFVGNVTIRQHDAPGTRVTAIDVAPADRIVAAPDLTGRDVSVVAGPGVTEVTFTDVAGPY